MFDAGLIRKIRADFPRAERDAWGRSRAFLDNGTGTLVAKRAAEAEARARVDYSANVEGPFDESKGADRVILEGRSAVADLLNAPSPENIVSGESATSLLFGLSYAIGKELRGDENVVTTDYEHYANLSPWLELKRRNLVKDVRLAKFSIEDGTLNLDHLESLIDENTRVVTVSAASNVLGSRTSLEEVSRRAKEAEAYYIVDSVHHIAHGPMDVQAIGCDFLVFSGYKLFSPHGSFMYGRREPLEELKPYKVKTSPEHPPESWEWGTRDQAMFAAISGVVDHIEWLGSTVEGGLKLSELSRYSGRPRRLKAAMYAIEEYERGLSRAMLAGIGGIPGLSEMPHVKVYGLTNVRRLAERDPTFSFEVKGLTNKEVVERLWSKYSIALRSENFYSRVHEVYDVPRMIRASFVHYNTIEEARTLVSALNEMKPR